MATARSKAKTVPAGSRRRRGHFVSADIHRALFGGRSPEAKSLAALKEGIRRYVRRRYTQD
jgi:hypothetical protein